MNQIRLALSIALTACIAGCTSTNSTPESKIIKDQQAQIEQMKQLDKNTMEMLSGITQQFQTARTDLEKRDQQIQQLKDQLAKCQSDNQQLKAQLPKPGGDVKQGLEQIREMQKRAAAKAREANDPNHPQQ